MRRQLALIISLMFIGSHCYAGDYHQNDSAHLVIYTVTDSSGNPVSGETVRLTLWRPRDNKYFDWSDSTWDAIGSVTTLHQTMLYNATSGVYYYTISNDNGTLISGDIVCTISDESATYGEQQSEAVYFDRLEKIVRINR